VRPVRLDEVRHRLDGLTDWRLRDAPVRPGARRLQARRREIAESNPARLPGERVRRFRAVAAAMVHRAQRPAAAARDCLAASA
jgi:hypothetical protein